MLCDAKVTPMLARDLQFLRMDVIMPRAMVLVIAQVLPVTVSCAISCLQAELHWRPNGEEEVPGREPQDVSCIAAQMHDEF